VSEREQEVVRRLLRAALREEPGPYRLRLAMREWERIKSEGVNPHDQTEANR